MHGNDNHDTQDYSDCIRGRLSCYLIEEQELEKPILRRLLLFSPVCSAMAFFAFAISRSNIACVTSHRSGFESTLPA